MTESQWNACEEPDLMLEHLEGKVKREQLVEFVRRCWEHVTPHLPPHRGERTAADQFAALERAVQMVVDKENKALLAAGAEGIMGAQGRTNLASQIRDRLVNCLEQRKNYEKRS